MVTSQPWNVPLSYARPRWRLLWISPRRTAATFDSLSSLLLSAHILHSVRRLGQLNESTTLNPHGGIKLPLRAQNWGRTPLEVFCLTGVAFIE